VTKSSASTDLEIRRADTYLEFPDWATPHQVAQFFHEKMKPYEDSLDDVQSALDYAFRPGAGQGGFIALAHREEQLLGACLMLKTGMTGYIPEWILLMVGVDPEQRGQGIGGRIIDYCLDQAPGSVKLHVEYDNPAKRLYERIGFKSKYAEMRLER
jgi:GNAT superfamily N-acetyltransferase